MLKDEQRAEAEKLKNATLQQKLSYFLTYYRLPAIAILAAICMAAIILSTVLRSRQPKLFVVITDQQGDGLQTELLSEQYQTAAKAPLPIVYDTSLKLAPRETTETNFIAYEKLLALYQSKTIDIFLAPETVFEEYGADEMFLPLDKILTKEEFSALEKQNRIVHVTLKDYTADPNHPTEGETIAAGIYLGDNALADSCGLSLDNGCIGITYNSVRPEEALCFIRLFL